MWPSIARIERGSERGLVLVLFAHNFYLLLNWPIFLMFAVSENQPTIFGGFFRHLRQWSDLFVSLRKSSLVFGNLRWPSETI